MANITERRRKDGKTVYKVQVRVKGHPSQTATFERKTDAKRWGQQTESAIREGHHFPTVEAKRHTVAELLDRFVRDELPKMPKVEALWLTQLTWWRNQIGHYTLADVTPALISECRDYLSQHGTPRQPKITPATVNRYLAALSRVFSAAVKEWGWMDDSPMRRVRKLPEPIGRVRCLDSGERERLLRECKQSDNEYLYPLVILALSTGARQGELLTLRWKDVDMQKRRITLHETKNGERRSLPLFGPALEAIQRMMKVRRIDTELLFPSRRHPDKPISIRHPWIMALRRAEIHDFRFHDLRHSAASYLAMNGATLVEIAAVLGHKTLQMVKRYTHISESHTAGVVERMNKSIFG